MTIERPPSTETEDGKLYAIVHWTDDALGLRLSGLFRTLAKAEQVVAKCFQPKCYDHSVHPVLIDEGSDYIG